MIAERETLEQRSLLPTNFGSSRAVHNDLREMLDGVKISKSGIPVQKILIPEPMGFCAGVEMAINTLNEVVKQFPDRNLIGYHGIVHNPYVIGKFEEQGVNFVDEVSDAPADSIVVLSPHGTAPQVIEKAKQDGRSVIDTVCPLVTKVHNEAKRMVEEGRIIIYIGHEGHDEAEGVRGYVPPENFYLVESEEEIDELAKNLSPELPVAILTQTTLAQGTWQPIAEAVKKYWPDVWSAPKKDVCYATTNRQEAVERLVQEQGAEIVLVVTSEQSSNGKALVYKAVEAGVESFLIKTVEDLSEIKDSLLNKVVGITAGASTPAQQVAEVIAGLSPENGIEFMEGVVEEQKFHLPKELQQLINEQIK